MHIWIEAKTEVKLTLRLLQDEAEDVRNILLSASNNLVLTPEQHRLANSLATALESPECPMK